MNARKGILESMETAKTNGEEVFICDVRMTASKIDDVLQMSELYYKMYDLENHTVHALIFEALYIASEEESYERIAERYFIDCSTLKRYVKRYNRFAERYINAQKSANCPFDTSTGVLQSI